VNNTPYTSSVAPAKPLGSESGFNSIAAGSFATNIAGRLLGLSVPIDLPFRKVWAAFSTNPSPAATFFKGEIRFLRYNSLLFSLPVATITWAVGMPIGTTVEAFGGFTISPTAQNVKDLLYVAMKLPSTGTLVEIDVLPWQVYSQCDEIELHSITANLSSTDNLAYLACLSCLHNAF
jgi:hypothetical protein